ncbi:hypothetical protein Hanom_Chr09g00797691 [Helianthus anomalus]
MERLNAGATVTYGATVSYGGAELFTLDAYCCTVGKFYYRGHRNLRCHRTLWMPEDDQAQRRTEHDIDTCFRTLTHCKF